MCRSSCSAGRLRHGRVRKMVDCAAAPAPPPELGNTMSAAEPRHQDLRVDSCVRRLRLPRSPAWISRVEGNNKSSTRSVWWRSSDVKEQAALSHSTLCSADS